MFDINLFEIEYKNFIIGLRIKKYGRNYDGYQENKDELDKLMKTHMEKKTKNNNVEKYNKILQLRKDIQNGNVVKVPCGNGRFVWKKIK